ncbi:MAG: hypothetical protein NZO16_07270, partial [Deltaproteobacteria bacterium]|nr:hypothetical protein [Deltaproteobacteria bacterium]
MREICEAICTNTPEYCQHLRFNPIYFIRHCYDRSEKQQVPPQPNEWVQHLERVFVDLSSFGLPTRFASEMVYTGLNQMILVAPYELPISFIVEDFLTACEKFVEQAKSEKKVSVDWKKLLNSESDYKGI